MENNNATPDLEKIRKEEALRQERMRENPFDSITSAIVFDVADWSTSRRMAWIYGIVCGWSEESLQELGADHNWAPSELARLKRLHERFSQAAKESGALLCKD